MTNWRWMLNDTRLIIGYACIAIYREEVLGKVTIGVSSANEMRKDLSSIPDSRTLVRVYEKYKNADVMKYWERACQVAKDLQSLPKETEEKKPTKRKK